MVFDPMELKFSSGELHYTSQQMKYLHIVVNNKRGENGAMIKFNRAGIGRKSTFGRHGGENLSKEVTFMQKAEVASNGKRQGMCIPGYGSSRKKDPEDLVCSMHQENPVSIPLKTTGGCFHKVNSS